MYVGYVIAVCDVWKDLKYQTNVFLVRIEQEYSSVVHARNTIVLKAECFLEKIDEYNKKC